MMKQTTAAADLCLMVKRDVCKVFAVSEATIDRWLRSDPDFPQPRRFGPNSIRWIKSEVMAYMLSLPRIAYDDHAFDPNAADAADEDAGAGRCGSGNH